MRRAERLRLLHDVHQAIARPIESSALLQLILDRVFELMGPEEGAILLRRPDGSYYRAAGRTAFGIERGWTVSRNLLRQVAEQGKTVLVSDISGNQRVAPTDRVPVNGARSLLAAPLSDGDGTLGMIVLASRTFARRFNEEDLRLLVSLAGLATLWLRNASLERDAAERRRLEAEVRMARRIQVQLLRSPLPEITGWELLARSQPSRGPSGDFYLVQRLGQDPTAQCFLLLADVAGKGVGAALLTASLEALVAGRLASEPTAAEIGRTVSDLLFQRTESAKYATAFFALLDPQPGRLRWVNAGHHPVLVVRADGELETLRSTGPPLGLLPSASYATAETLIRPGDTLVIYSDGLLEAENPAEEEFGLERLGQLLRRDRAEPLPAVAESLEAALRQFTDGQPAVDDRTLVLARRQTE